MSVHDEVELEVLRAVDREACVHVAGFDLSVHRGEVHDVTLTESGQSRLAASRPDGDPH